MTQLVAYLLLFLAVSVFFVIFHLLLGKLIRPSRPSAEKKTIYECGEPTIGSAWVQFDMRIYVVALLFVIFDVEVAFFFPWAVVFGQANTVANPYAKPEDRKAALAALELKQEASADPTADQAKAAGKLAGIAFVDIFVFFAVLLVGFAYLWKRGDLEWVRSTAAEQAPPTEAVVERGELVGAGQS